MAKMSVMVMCFHRSLRDGVMTPAAVVKGLADAGVTGLEPASGYCEEQPAQWEELKRAAADAGMHWSCCDVGVNFIGDGSEQARQQALDTTARAVELCSDIDCPAALLAGTRPAEGMSHEEGRRIYGDMLAVAAEKNAGSGVTLTIEDFGVHPLFTAAGGHCAEVLERAGEDIQFTFDNGNFLLGGDLPTECYSLFRGRIAHVHIKDFRVRTPDDRPSLVSPTGVGYEGCPIGEGDAQVRGCLKLLKADTYAGWLSIEAGGYDNVEPAAVGARVISETWDSA